jgi:hypothetical protein
VLGPLGLQVGLEDGLAVGDPARVAEDQLDLLERLPQLAGGVELVAELGQGVELLAQGLDHDLERVLAPGHGGPLDREDLVAGAQPSQLADQLPDRLPLVAGLGLVAALARHRQVVVVDHDQRSRVVGAHRLGVHVGRAQPLEGLLGGGLGAAHLNRLGADARGPEPLEDPLGLGLVLGQVLVVVAHGPGIVGAEPAFLTRSPPTAPGPRRGPPEPRGGPCRARS